MTFSAQATGVEPLYRFSYIDYNGIQLARYMCNYEFSPNTSCTMTLNTNGYDVPGHEFHWTVEVIDALSDQAHMPNDTRQGSYILGAP